MINILPDDIKDSRRYAHRNVLISRYATFLGIVLLLLVGMYAFGYISLAQTAKTAEKAAGNTASQLAGLQSVTERAQTLSDTIKTTNTLLQREIRFSELIQEIGAIMPPKARLTNLTLTNDQTKPLTIEAIVADEDQALTLKENLLQSDVFEGADIQSIQSSNTNDNSVTTRIITGFKQPEKKPTGATL